MADDRDRGARRPADGDATVQIPAELLSILPPPPEAEAAPPRPPGPAAPPPPPPGPAAAPPDPVTPPPPRTSVDDGGRRGGGGGGGALWLVGALVVVVLFIAACYFLVARAEDDRPTASDVPVASTEAPVTTAPTTVPPPETRPPADVAVIVLNGSGQRGWAGENVTKLSEAGYTAEASDASSEDIETTTVYIAEEALAPDGAAVATAIGLPDAPVQPRAEDSPGVTEAAAEADVVVVLGADSLG